MLSYYEAFALIEEQFEKLEVETEIISLADSVNRTVAENIIADMNLPPFDNSAVDGIAIKYTKGIEEWELVGEISAGNYKSFELRENQAVSIMTGAKVPIICDTVIPLEDYDVSGDGMKMNEDAKFKKGMNIRPKASDVSEGEIVVPKFTHLSPRNIAAIAACGKSRIAVMKKLKFAILSTGDELVPVNEVPTGDKIRASNNLGLSGAVIEVHQVGNDYGFIADDYETTKNKIKEMLNSDADIIITTGGVSVGKFDYVKNIYAELGIEEIFWRAYIKPGKPAFFGKFSSGKKTKLVFGLPGNPVSCMVNFDVYIKPNIIKKFGMKPQVRIFAKLMNDIRKKDGKRHFVRGKIIREDGKYFFTSHLSQSSGDLSGFSSSNCLVEVKEDTLNPRKGDVVECILM